KMLAEEDAKTTRTPGGAGTSDPLDLAHEYGEFSSEQNHAMQHGIYLCIWRLESDGTWKIALDLQKSAPTEKRRVDAEGWWATMEGGVLERLTSIFDWQECF